MKLGQLAVVPAVLLVTVGVEFAVAPSAAADCVSSSGTTICSQGDVRGADTGDGPSGSTYTPYPCEYDWYCYDGFDVVLGIDGPGGGVDIGRPGGPVNNPPGGNRPGRGRGR